MPSYTPLVPVSEAIYGVLVADATLQALIPGGAQTDVPEDPTYPFLWIEILEQQQFGGFGTKPGLHTLPELAVRFHAFSQFRGMAECHVIIARVLALMADPPVVAGHGSWAIFHDQTLPLPNQELNGVKVQEMVSMHRLYVEEN